MSSSQSVAKEIHQDVMNYVLNRYKTLPSFKPMHYLNSEQKISLLKEDMSATSNSNKTKHATMGIYRPPSLRSGDGFMSNASKAKLNVHAKEFVMNDSNSKSFDDGKFGSKYVNSDRSYSLNLSKSSGNVFNLTKSNSSQFRTNDSQKFISNSSAVDSYDLQKESSNGFSSSKVQFKMPFVEKNEYKTSGKTSPTKKSPLNFGSQALPGKLKRSKSLNAADALKFIALEASYTAHLKTFTEYDLFPEQLRSTMRQAVEHTDRMEEKNKIVLARTVVEHTLNDKKLALPTSKLSVIIMDKDKTGAYLDSLLNTCQMLYQMKKMNALSDLAKFAAFLVFLQELYTELKRSNLQLKLLADSTVPPKSIFLFLIGRCCEDILVRSETHSVAEIECVFLALTTMGRDIEIKIPSVFKKLFDLIREILLKSRNGPEVQKILLQLIELRAANWQLPISALNYYYPKSSV